MDDLVESELVHAMVNAFRGGIIGSATEQREDFKGMTAAAKVLLDAALGEIHVGDTEWKECVEPKEAGRFYMSAAEFNGIMRDRKARLLAPKTVEISVEYVSAHGFGWRVFADGDERGLFSNEADAQTFKAGLIAEMKKGMKP